MSFLFRSKKEYEDLNIPTYRSNYSHVKGDHTLVDVRTRGEFMSGHLPGAINIPLQQLANRVNEIAKDKPVIVVCATGNRSQTGSNIIARAGYTDVFNLQGGTMTWMMNGFPLEH